LGTSTFARPGATHLPVVDSYVCRECRAARAGSFCEIPIPGREGVRRERTSGSAPLRIRVHLRAVQRADMRPFSNAPLSLDHEHFGRP
jgi:hypothetical protein